MATSRDYDIVLLGATGYTAAICAEYIVKTLPTDLKWAVAGRSRAKLEALVQKLKLINPDRLYPAIEIVELDSNGLENLAKRSRLILNGIGPYHLYSTPVVKACAKEGTHYVGFSLETPWVEEMIHKYHNIAKGSGSIIIPTTALAPSDIVGFMVAQAIHEQPKSGGTAEVNSTAKLEIEGMSAGSLNTVMSLMSSYGTSWIWPGNPWSLTPSTHRHPPPSTPSLLSRIFGYRNIPGLGVVTTSFLAICNESIAHRSASLLPEIYGPHFHHHEFLPAPNFFAAAFIHFLTKLGIILLSLSPFRKLMNSLLPAPGTGPDLAKADVERQHFQAIGTPANPDGKKAKGRFLYEGSLYYCSAAMGVEAAVVILGDEKTPAHGLGGGILTPAMLGMPFVEKVREAGAKIDVELLG